MNYNSLMNKPTINYRELIGDNSVTEVGGITEEQFNTLLNTDLSSYYTKAQIDDLFSRSYVYREKSGSIVTFDCPASVNGINKVVSEIVAVQSGTGDPSPTNVRPFTGWSAVNVVDSGVNVWDEEWEVGDIDAQGNPTSSTTLIRTKNFNPCKPNTTYKIVIPSGASMYMKYYDKDKNFISPTVSAGSTITPPSNCYYFKFVMGSSYGTHYNNNISINYPSTDTEYHAYNGTTYTTALKDGQGNPLTCYGGQLTNENGVQTLDNTDGIIDLGSINWNYSNGRFVTGRIVDIKAPVNNFTVAKIMCSIYKTVTSSATENPANDFSIGINIYQYICIRDSRYSDPTDFKTAMSGILLKYEKATPQQIPQDNLAIATQEGTNNIWCDTGDITVKALDKIIQG